MVPSILEIVCAREEKPGPLKKSIVSRLEKLCSRPEKFSRRDEKLLSANEILL